VLAERELVSKTVSKGVTLYKIVDPEALVHEAEQRAVLAKKVAENLKEKRQAGDREVLIYEGEDIIKRISDKNLDAEKGSTVYFLGPSKFGVQKNLEAYWKQYHKKRIEKGIHCKLLYDRSTDPEILKERNTLPFCEARYLPFGTEMAMWFNICGDSVSMIVPSEEPPLAFLLKSSKSADALKKYFDYLWEQSNNKL
jgi:hypothetical protein